MVFFKFHFNNKCFVFDDIVQINFLLAIQSRIHEYKSKQTNTICKTNIDFYLDKSNCIQHSPYSSFFHRIKCINMG